MTFVPTVILRVPGDPVSFSTKGDHEVHEEPPRTLRSKISLSLHVTL
jgi:hypothetical protein